MDDRSLLDEYVRSRSQDAFRQLVDRQVPMVYSAGRRIVRDPQLAEEVAQNVFTTLAQKADSIRPPQVIGGWLYNTTRHLAMNAVRTEQRRREREQTAFAMQTLDLAPDPAGIAEHLEPAMAELDAIDRDALVLRYLEDRNLREVGAELGISEDAARKRVDRALERLRAEFHRQGVAMTSVLLATAITTSASAVPAGLGATISAAVLAGTTLPTTATATVTKAIVMTATQKALIAVALAAAVGTGIYEAHQASILRTQVQTLQQQAPLTEQIAQLTRERDEAAGQLAALRGDREALSRAIAELVKLRGEVMRLKTELQEMAQRSARGTNDQTLSDAVAWKNRVNQLKQYLEQFPAAKIPELQFVTEEDWLNTAKEKLNTERDYRRASSSLRGLGEYKVVNMLQKALRGYLKASNEQFPTDLIQLQPYFDSPVDEAVLQRWQIAPAATVQNYGLVETWSSLKKRPWMMCLTHVTPLVLPGFQVWISWPRKRRLC